ncbi:MAG: hypothetical protein KDC98_21225 [Planctomycetes bacterium]|nr:hypothetical protein [Planctomycetota bacterium]
MKIDYGESARHDGVMHARTALSFAVLMAAAACGADGPAPGTIRVEPYALQGREGAMLGGSSAMAVRVQYTGSRPWRELAVTSIDAQGKQTRRDLGASKAAAAEGTVVESDAVACVSLHELTVDAQKHSLLTVHVAHRGGDTLSARAIVDDLLPSPRSGMGTTAGPTTEVAEDQPVVLWRTTFAGGGELRVELTMR